MPASWLIIIVPTLCGTTIFLAVLIALVVVYFRGGAEDTLKFAKAIREVADSLRMHRLLDGVAAVFEARAKQKAIEEAAEKPDDQSADKQLPTDLGSKKQPSSDTDAPT